MKQSARRKGNNTNVTTLTKETNNPPRRREGAPSVPIVTQKKNHPTYTTGRKLWALELIKSGMPYSRVQAETGISTGHLVRLTKDERLMDLTNDKVMERTKRSLASNFYWLADKASAKAGEEDRINKMSSFQLAGISGLAYDKARLADGLSTENISIRGMIDHIKGERDKVREMRESLEATVLGKKR